MKKTLVRFTRDFHVVLANRRCEAAEMVIAPGDAEGDRENTHRDADQWLFVLSGVGTGFVNDQRYQLRRHSLMLIEHGDRHEIRNTGPTPLVTLNFYTPPAYTRNDDTLPAGRRLKVSGRRTRRP